MIEIGVTAFSFLIKFALKIPIDIGKLFLFNIHRFCSRNFMKYIEVVLSVQFCSLSTLPSSSKFL